MINIMELFHFAVSTVFFNKIICIYYDLKEFIKPGKVGVTDPKNIARKGTAEQIDDNLTTKASNAIDGIR